MEEATRTVKLLIDSEDPLVLDLTWRLLGVNE